MKKMIETLLVLCFIGGVQAQTNRTVFPVLQMENSARQTATGGNLITIKDHDLSLGVNTASLLNEEMNNHLSFHYLNYFSGINYSSASYAKHIDSVGTFSAAIHYLNYGTFPRTNEFGDIIGDFSAADAVVNLGFGREIDSLWSIGGNLKFITSSIDAQNSSGIALDISSTYYNAKKGFTATGVIRNAGIQLSTYSGEDRENLPFEIQMGISQKLKHAPFRFSLILENLQKWDLTYVDPTIKPKTDLVTQEVIPIKEAGLVEKAMRHVVASTEFILSDNLRLNFGFNYRRRQELKLTEKPGTTGFSMGIDLKVSKFYFSYGRATYHRTGASNHFSITTNINEWKVKK